ncbi:MAG: glycosyltransferase family 4 protein [Candidatus Promineifilaceae bacterium]
MNLVGRNILLLSPFVSLPATQGSVVRINQLARYLSRQNRVWYACRGPAHTDQLPFVQQTIYGANFPLGQLVDPLLVIKLRKLIRDENIDLIVSGHFWSTLHGCLLQHLTGLPHWFDNHNVEYLRFQRENKAYWPILRAMERFGINRAQWTTCVSEFDQSILATLGKPTNVIAVAPNGVDMPLFMAAHSALPQRPTVAFMGSAHYRPNLEATHILLKTLRPLILQQQPDAHFLIIGSGYDTIKDSYTEANIRFSGFVDDVIAEMQKASVFVAPLLLGSGTRIKILEGVASQRPVVSTTIGAEGLNRNVFGDMLFIADEWEPFAAQVVQCLHQTEHVIPHSFFQAHDWTTIFDQLTPPATLGS